MVKDSLETINARLKAGKVGVTVRQRGDRLSLRATLPPKPGSEKKTPYQQDISLSIYANPAGLRRAEAEAKKLGSLLACKEFSWESYLHGESSPEKTCAALVEEFKEDYFSRHGNSPIKLEQWRVSFNYPFKELPQDQPLTHKLVTSILAKIPPDTRKRNLFHSRYDALIKFHKLDININDYRGTYNRSKIKPRELPSDDVIVQSRSLLKKDWQWVYGVIACYGLRPHEAFFATVEDVEPYRCFISEGKTGSRISYPLHPNWATDWELWDKLLPNIKSSTHKTYGNRICRAFSRANVPFTPYSLRHAYAIRATVHYRLPVTISARWMGHGENIHLATYQRWLNEADELIIFNKLVENKFSNEELKKV